MKFFDMSEHGISWKEHAVFILQLIAALTVAVLIVGVAVAFIKLVFMIVLVWTTYWFMLLGEFGGDY